MIFQAGDIVRHRGGSEYQILYTPNRAAIEATGEPVYVYTHELNKGVVWIRPQKEMEDGRFTYVRR